MSTESIRSVGRWALAGFLLTAGVAHFVRTEEFLGQVPTFLPARTAIVYVSGVAEVALAAALVALPGKRVAVGWATAGFFVLVFPGNIYQAVAGVPAFGMDATARWLRLAFQPVFVVWALWSTGAWRAWRASRPS
jgi:uncharacterized membrane protein